MDLNNNSSSKWESLNILIEKILSFGKRFLVDESC